LLIGNNAGNSNQGAYSIAIGRESSTTSQGVDSLSIGSFSGNTSQGNNAIALGYYAGYNQQGNSSIAIGQGVGLTTQGTNSIAIGQGAGATNQGAYSIAIGKNSGQTNQPSQSIIINASSSTGLDASTDGLFINPIRDMTGPNSLFYNPISKEITYSTIEIGATGPQGLIGPTGPGGTVGSWTLSTGANTVSFTVPVNSSYSMWVNGNIPLGICTWNATVTITNTNVPVLGVQYAWYYADGNNLVLTSIPNQIVGTAGTIVTTSVATTTANTFTFGITNNSGSSQIIYYGYTKI
jgi:hypothetical protein